MVSIKVYFAFCVTGDCNEKTLVSDVVRGLIAALE